MSNSFNNAIWSKFLSNKINFLIIQLSDAEKDDIPEEVKRAAREMNRKAFEEKLREIRMSEYDADLYNQFSNAVTKQVCFKVNNNKVNLYAFICDEIFYLKNNQIFLRFNH